MERQKTAYIYAILAISFWATAASAFKISLRYMGFLQLLLFASMFSIITLSVIMIFQHKLHLLKTYSKKQYLRSAVLGLMNPFLYYVVLFKAYSLLPAQQAMTLNYVWPIMLVLLSIPLLKQRIGWKSILAIFIGFSGVLLISTEGNILTLKFTNLPGVLLALSSSIIWALFWIYNLKDERDEVAKLFLNFVFGFIFVLVLIIISGKIRITCTPGIFGSLYVGLFEMSITFVLWLKALKLSRTTAQVGNLIYIAPFLSLIVIHLILGEKILLPTVMGLVLIISGVILQHTSNT